MRHLRRPLHRFDQRSTANPVVPCLAKIIIRSVQLDKDAVRHHRIAGFQTHRRRLRRILRTHIQQHLVARKYLGPLIRRCHVNVANAGHGMDRSLRSKDDPSLIHQRLVKPAS